MEDQTKIEITSLNSESVLEKLQTENDLLRAELREKNRNLAEIENNLERRIKERTEALENAIKSQRSTELMLIQSARMSFLGHLVAGLAHELNNPISAVLGNLELVKEFLDRTEQLCASIENNSLLLAFSKKINDLMESIKRDYPFDEFKGIIQDITKSIQRIHDVFINLKKFSMFNAAEYKETDLNEGLESTIGVLKSRTPSEITIHKNFGELPLTYSYAGHLNDVFFNILNNSIESISGKGNIWITTRKIDSDIEIIFSDDGKGIPEEILNNLFDPFFSTKDPGMGYGLGLSVAFSIINKHEGSIRISNRPEGGAEIDIMLPIKKM